MLYRLKSQGLSVLLYEAGSGVGGTWYWNRYPGARCDIESMEYSYQFSEDLQQDWSWTERYSSQPEILAYINHVADRFQLTDDIQFDTRVVSAIYDESMKRWQLTTDDNVTTIARYCVMATGCLSSANTPDIEGIDSFKGNTYHTGQWPHEGVDFTGQRVGIIGTGSSAVQSIPIIAREADQLTVFQRTATYSIPAHNKPLDAKYVKDIKANYAEFRETNNSHTFAASFEADEFAAVDSSPETLQQRYLACWDNGGLGFLAAFNDLVLDKEANDTARDFLHGKIKDIVDDPEVAELLLPRQTVGCKRLCVDTGYFETFNRDNVLLVNVEEQPITRISENGVVVGETEYPVDSLIFATGFDAMTGALNRIDIRGKAGLTLAEKWHAGPRTYLGLPTSGFPNLFTISGPGSPSVLTNMLPSIEQHVNWISDCIRYMTEHNLSAIEATTEAEDDWVDHVNEIADSTLFPTCNSWYLGANVPGKPRVFMPYFGFPPYVEKCVEVAENGYEGFALSN